MQHKHKTKKINPQANKKENIIEIKLMFPDGTPSEGIGIGCFYFFVLTIQAHHLSKHLS